MYMLYVTITLINYYNINYKGFLYLYTYMCNICPYIIYIYIHMEKYECNYNNKFINNFRVHTEKFKEICNYLNNT